VSNQDFGKGEERGGEKKTKERKLANLVIFKTRPTCLLESFYSGLNAFLRIGRAKNIYGGEKRSGLVIVKGTSHLDETSREHE